MHIFCFKYSCLCQQLYTIPPIRSGILSVEEAAKEFIVLEEQEKEREEKERNQRDKLNSIDVSYSDNILCVICMHYSTICMCIVLKSAQRVLIHVGY